jgi:single-strand DNA-binding protein
MNYNKVILVGRAGAHAETRVTATGERVTRFSLATNARTKGGGENTEWHTVVTFGALAETCQQLVRKGALLLVEGRIQSRQWTDKSGAQRKVWEVIASLVSVQRPPRQGEAEQDTGEIPL